MQTRGSGGALVQSLGWSYWDPADGSTRQHDTANELWLTLSSNSTLTTLDASNNGLTAQSLITLAYGIKSDGTLDLNMLAYGVMLTSLNLSHNRIKASGAKHIARALQFGGVLRHLDISHCALADGDRLLNSCLRYPKYATDTSGVVALARAIQGNKTLTDLDLAHNTLGQWVLPEGWFEGEVEAKVGFFIFPW